MAGYSARTARVIGPDNLSKPAIKQALEARQAVFRAELRVTKEDVVNGLLNAIQMGREQKNPVVMIQGCVQLAKLLGFYEPEVIKVGISGDAGRLQAKFAAMSDEELLMLCAEPTRTV